MSLAIQYRRAERHPGPWRKREVEQPGAEYLAKLIRAGHGGLCFADLPGDAQNYLRTACIAFEFFSAAGVRRIRIDAAWSYRIADSAANAAIETSKFEGHGGSVDQ
jgi:hypothetical protein